MTANSRETAVVAGLLELFRLPLDTPEPVLLTRVIDLAEAVTGSRIGYVHYVNEDQVTIELGTWSTATVATCAVVSDRHYPVDEAGVWADAFRTRSPHVHNDYPAVSNRRGLPPGHVALVRHVGVPVIDGGAVRLLLGVGNKETPYDDRDVEAVQQIADDAWLLVTRLRSLSAVRGTISMLDSQPEVLRLCAWEWDPDADADSVRWGANVDRVLGVQPGDPGVSTWRPLMDAIDLESGERLRGALDTVPDDGPLDVSLTGTVGGRARAFRITGGWTQRTTGHGQVMRGVLTDISVLVELDAVRANAERDPLTGLLNRSGLFSRVGPRFPTGRMRSQDEFAILFVDLDGFKAVNDRMGHIAGDAVLRTCAQRLASCVRTSDVVARFGGDEFVIVQGGGPDPEQIESLARKIIARISEPMHVDGSEIAIGASIGAARSSNTLPGLDAMLLRADAAMYQAKTQRCGVVIAGGPGAPA